MTTERQDAELSRSERIKIGNAFLFDSCIKDKAPFPHNLVDYLAEEGLLDPRKCRDFIRRREENKQVRKEIAQDKRPNRR